ncbi:MAG TPA: DUF393 domain-containing protein [Planctomycetaceae bacterium]|nr:DUF393 domain-containing protein [Planctomycetaceae bacterium]
MLPTPHNWPDTDVVIYDGQCSFCTKQVTKLHRWDGKNRLSFISLHDDFVAEHYPDLSHDEMMQAMYIVDQKGRRHRGAAALRVISRRLPRLWPLAILLHIPLTLPLWQWGYRQVARRRYRLSCDNGSCELHFNNTRQRSDSNSGT